MVRRCLDVQGISLSLYILVALLVAFSLGHEGHGSPQRIPDDQPQDKGESSTGHHGLREEPNIQQQQGVKQHHAHNPPPTQAHEHQARDPPPAPPAQVHQHDAHNPPHTQAHEHQAHDPPPAQAHHHHAHNPPHTQAHEKPAFNPPHTQARQHQAHDPPPPQAHDHHAHNAPLTEAHKEERSDQAYEHHKVPNDNKDIEQQQQAFDSGFEPNHEREDDRQIHQYEPLADEQPSSVPLDKAQEQYSKESSPDVESEPSSLEEKLTITLTSTLSDMINTDEEPSDREAFENEEAEGQEDPDFDRNEDGADGQDSVDAPPEPAPEPPRQLTPEEIEAEELYQAGEKLINATYYKEYKEAYLLFTKSADLGNTKAMEYVAFGSLFGDYLPQNITLASEIFEELSSKGMPRAQMGLAFMYSAGFHYNSSQAKALIYSTFGALGGDPLAQMALGYRYYAGIGVESKCETALTYYRKVAAKVAEGVTFAGGPVVQRVRLQEEAENQGNNSPLLDDDLLQYYHFLADKGDQQAQIVLGTLYYQGGKGVVINHEQAYHYFSTAAESGNGHALGYLGKMHSEGSPYVKQNNNTAFEYFKIASEKNNHIGQAGLGLMYLNGYGVDKDTNKAFRYFTLASDQGSVDGQLQLGIMYFTGNGVRRDYKMAVKYFTLASQNGHVLAFYNLAQMHATGTGVLRNCHTAVELFKNVAERGRWSEMMMDAHRMYQAGNADASLIKYMFLAELGYEVAQSNVAYMLDSSLCHSFDKHETYQRALLQYSRAAVQGSTQARLKIGDYHYYGFGTIVDYESAASHYRMASEQQRNAQAMFNLGYMHERGLGLKQDVHLAKRFYDMAAETSVDAHVPVTLALFKLGLLYGVDVFSKEFDGASGILNLLDLSAYFGVAWDIYLAAFLALCFTILFYRWRMR